jgi:hypothetical protein
MQESHHYRESLVGRADHADAAVALGHILGEPVDGVVRIGGVVRAGAVEARVHGQRRHQVRAFGAILAADILVNADVAIFHKTFVGEWKLIEERARRGRGWIAQVTRGVIGRTRQHDGRIVRSFENKNDGEELDTVAHGHHNHTAIVIAFYGRRLEVRRHLVAANFDWSGLRGLRASDCGAAEQGEDEHGAKGCRHRFSLMECDPLAYRTMVVVAECFGVSLERRTRRNSRQSTVKNRGWGTQLKTRGCCEHGAQPFAAQGKQCCAPTKTRQDSGVEPLLQSGREAQPDRLLISGGGERRGGRRGSRGCWGRGGGAWKSWSPGCVRKFRRNCRQPE